jgi:predicted kinase
VTGVPPPDPARPGGDRPGAPPADLAADPPADPPADPAIDPAAAPVWVVAGAPGAGKSTVAALLARLARPAPALLDKDTLFGGLVAALLAAHGRPHGEREGEWYDRHVKVHEYAAMAAAAAQIRAAGCPPLLVAPFTGQIRDPARWQALVTDLGGEPVRLVWVRCAEATLRRRLATRARGRDAGKLAAFADFAARMRPTVPPAVPHHPIDNSGPAARLPAQVAAVIAARWSPGSGR